MEKIKNKKANECRNCSQAVSQRGAWKSEHGIFCDQECEQSYLEAFSEFGMKIISSVKVQTVI